MSPKTKLSFLLIALLVAGLACNFNSSGGGEAEVSTPETSDPSLLFSDDFSTSATNWTFLFQDESGIVDLDQDGFRIQVNESNSDYWAIPGLFFTDASIEVDARSIGGPSDGDFGVICRHTDDDNFYSFLATLDGYYAIVNTSAGSQSLLGSDYFEETGAVNSGTATNHLRADCVGSTLTFYINGTQVTQVTDTTHSAGDVGLIAGTFDIAGSDFIFDNFTVRQP